MAINWVIHREGRAWDGDEMRARWELTPEKFEVYQGKLFWSEEDRRHLLAMLLENEGADAAVRIGDPAVWKAAVARLYPVSPVRVEPGTGRQMLDEERAES